MEKNACTIISTVRRYMCTKWENSVPCIVTTNQEELYEILLSDPEFADVTVCVNIRDYIGHQGHITLCI